ncbi:Syntaxin-like protein psy1 [Daldinia childiae]|uniref:Syntaxin-like protein psy1 n=1 Tax=Daldinia childiae TaxID=326645 RepID=UPI001446CB7A|nr:Syntaxin-like protein psy1 [Daldinia childiae]KAF3058103.1 Syntaxin-like protein psy1 [Daldinia childiae]
MSYGQYQNNPYQDGSLAEQGYQEHELQNYPEQQQVSDTLPQQEFLNRIQFLRNEIRTLTSNVQTIASLHQRALAEGDGGAASQQLERVVADTQTLNIAPTRDMKDRQVATIKAEFERELSNYRQEENVYSQRYREQISRQYRIVNPEATEEEVRNAADADWGNEGVFQTALRTNRAGQASSVLGAVRARHNELQRIERTLIELANMFQDLAILVEQQDNAVNEAVNNAENTNKYIDEGNTHVEKGIVHARNRRKLKWWCLVVVILIIAIALGVGLGVAANAGLLGGNKNNNNNNGN